jgi:hypothetical protein
MEKITSIDQLNKLIEDEEVVDAFILLNGGCRTSKDISFGEDSNSYCVFNEIDGSDDTYTLEELKQSLIGEAMSKGALYKY